MNVKKFWIKALLRAFLLPPLVATLAIYLCFLPRYFVLFPGAEAASILAVGLPLAGFALAWLWVRAIAKEGLPGDFLSRYLPIFAAFAYYMLVWIAAFEGMEFLPTGASPGSLLLSLGALPFYCLTFFLLAFDVVAWFPWLLVFLYGIAAATVAVKGVSRAEGARAARAAMVLCLVALVAVAGAQDVRHRARTAATRANVLARDGAVERIGGEEVDPRDYLPFREGNLLPTLDEEPSLVIASDHPKLDGATAAYPIYGAAIQALYRGLDEKSVEACVGFSRTAGAYERLIEGEIDVFFGLQPSQKLLKMAEERGVTLVLTPIAREAFVFFVHRDNPVDALTLEQIRDIYRKKIVSWDAVGGAPERIQPFQRQENSASQTIMTALVMKGTPLPAPPEEELADKMGRVISRVAATYRNYPSALGYSFRYYATGMKPNDNIKLLSINGVAPTPENIRNGTYPFVVDLCAVTTGSESENARKLIDWCLSAQGQRLIERCGYVGLRGE